jgi:hypothetical protein
MKNVGWHFRKSEVNTKETRRICKASLACTVTFQEIEKNKVWLSSGLTFPVFKKKHFIFSWWSRSEIPKRINLRYFQSHPPTPKASLSSITCWCMEGDPELQIIPIYPPKFVGASTCHGCRHAGIGRFYVEAYLCCLSHVISVSPDIASSVFFAVVVDLITLLHVSAAKRLAWFLTLKRSGWKRSATRDRFWQISDR